MSRPRSIGERPRQASRATTSLHRATPRALHDIPRALRPRQKLIAHGPAVLSGSELVALLLGPGSRGESVLALADRLVRRRGLRRLAAGSARCWISEPGIGAARAARMAAAFELGRRVHAPDRGARPVLGRPSQVWRRVRRLETARQEKLIGLYVDAQNTLIHEETISVGSLNTTRTHPREILYPAVAHLALGFILAHNHPSGSLDPSAEDVEFTRVVRRAGELMGIELYDHLVIGRGGYTSLRERGLL